MTLGTKKTVIEVDYNELDKLFTATYGHEVEIVAAEEWNNDEEHAITADGLLTEYDERELKEFRDSGKHSFGITALLLNDLARSGVIERGEYLVTICW